LWKRGKHVSGVYDDVDLPYPDAKVSDRLCIGGPCKYVVKEGSGVTGTFLLEHVVPNMWTQYPDDVAKVLGKALIWFIFSPDSSNYLTTPLQDCVATTYNGIGQLPPGENPVKKIALVISGNKGELYLDELGENYGGGPGDRVGGGHQRKSNERDYGGGPGDRVGGGHQRKSNEREQLLALHSQIDQLNRIVGDMRTMQ
jgi:hypothetical protein